MKIYRADLEIGLDNTFFEIPGASLEMDNVHFAEDKLTCTIHSEYAAHGYFLKGSMDVVTIEMCDRCLADFQAEAEVRFSILLTNDPDLVNNDEHDILFFNEQSESVDIGPALAEYIALDRPLKALCIADCKGLCPSCGCNKNEQDCNCTNDTTDPRWDVLKKIDHE